MSTSVMATSPTDNISASSAHCNSSSLPIKPSSPASALNVVTSSLSRPSS
eukprot:CAMPEP_0114050678 /NCGR_PEP_ID=MMETSP1339-20121228/65952_1 /TAXON_ID=94617 /ORGANISM="Fibrocapsa japonica" /LENGTH=49 /assembly_acc=CAM_ASM_000762